MACVKDYSFRLNITEKIFDSRSYTEKV